ncbi:TadE/TadG family type IV pilus assembly protein [Acidocella sp.]|uniref:TadE/TadG family type IV pilus assembly protein n=1 Tax=Acidocella sp. TaxID=50710 RepID=UPI003D039E28
MRCLRFSGDRRGVTAIIWALLLPTMIISIGAAVDYARVAAERAQLQTAADQAALAGAGTYGNDLDGANAASVAQAAFNASFKGIANQVTLQQGQPTITVGCTGSDSSVCGTNTSNVTMGSGACSKGTYCVTVTATAQQTNSVIYFKPPYENMSVTATAQVTAGSSASSAGTTSEFADFAQSYYSGGNYYYGSGGSQMLGSHTSGIGLGTPSSGSSDSGNAYFLDGLNNTAPTAYDYDSLASPSYGYGGCSSGQSFSQDSNDVYNVPTDIFYCSMTLGSGEDDELYYIDPSSGSSWLKVTNSVTVSPRTTICPENLSYGSYSGTDVSISTTCASGSYKTANYTPIYLGGSLVLNYSVDVTPSTSNTGMITFVNDEYDNVAMLDNGAQISEYAVACANGSTSCSSSNAYKGTSLSFTGPGTLTSHDTYITTITVDNGIDTAWTEQEVFAVKFVQSCTGSGWNKVCGSSSSTKTETVTVAGGYDASGNATAQYHNVAKTLSTYSPSAYARDPSTDTNGVVTTNSTTGEPNDAYGLLDQDCKNNYAVSGSIGGTKSVGGSVAPLTGLSGLTDIFAMTTDAPPSSTPPKAYNFTNPNYGYSYVNQDEQGSALETETVYFCGNGPSLKVSSGSATGVTATATSGTGATLTN